MFNFEIENDKLRLRATDTFGDGTNCVLYLDKFDGEKWNAVVYPDFYVGSTSEEIYQQVEKAMVEINAYLENKYGKGGSAPIGGVDLVRYIVESQTSLEGIKLKITK